MSTTTEPTGDERVKAATAHWAARFVNNGTDFVDFQSTLARIHTWDEWCTEWGHTAERYETLARDAEQKGRTITAGEAWRRAALCWHWGKFVFTDYPDQLRAAHDRAIDCYSRGLDTLDPPARRVEVPYGDTVLAAYLRIPAASSPPPVVIMAPGLDSTKEEVQATAEYFLRRGMAILAVDGPGQGESEFHLPIEPAYEKVAMAAVDYLRTRTDIDPERIGLLGVSLGGYYASRSAAYEPRLRAVVALAGPYRFDLDWDMLPPQTRATFQYRSGATDPDDARKRAGTLTLEDAASLITGPFLIVHGRLDRLIPAHHAERVMAEAKGAEMLMYEDGNHGVTNYAFSSRAAMSDWMADHLGVGA
jgi:2,6-dihydroxypseudooxynicotine hydrolase